MNGIDYSVIYAREIYDKTLSEPRQETGYIMARSMPKIVEKKILQTDFNPFYKNMTFTELLSWIQNHLIFNEKGSIVALFDNDTMLWERE
jgi:hypothetical protein